MSAEAKLKSLGIQLPPAPKPVATYVPTVRVGNLLFVSGHGPAPSDKVPGRGRLGGDLSLEQGYQSARLVGLQLLATVRAALGSLDKVERVVKLLGMVNSTPEFSDHPKVVNGCSDLFVEIFGEERGKAARSAVGMGSLPGQIPVEIEAILEVR